MSGAGRKRGEARSSAADHESEIDEASFKQVEEAKASAEVGIGEEEQKAMTTLMKMMNSWMTRRCLRRKLSQLVLSRMIKRRILKIKRRGSSKHLKPKLSKLSGARIVEKKRQKEERERIKQEKLRQRKTRTRSSLTPNK